MFYVMINLVRSAYDMNISILAMKLLVVGSGTGREHAITENCSKQNLGVWAVFVTHKWWHMTLDGWI